MAVQFFTEQTSFKLREKIRIKNWIKQIASIENKKVGEISYIFCNDEYLHKMNQEYLNHDTLTDIITFDYTEGNILSGDIFISVERVEENAKEFNISFENELTRVLAHGILHLAGYKDEKTSEQKLMREKEDVCIKLFFEGK